MKDNNEYVFYCNESFKKEDLKMKNSCQFCGCEVYTSCLNTNNLPNWAKFNIKFGEYVREYCLCENCGKITIDAIGEAEKVIREKE